MVDGGRITRRAALGCIGSGAVLACSETFGFTNVTGTRGVIIETAANPEEALLGIIDNSANVGQVKDGSGDVFYLNDNTGGAFDFAASDVTIVDYAGCTSDTANDCPDVSIGLTSTDHDYAVMISCDGTDIKATETMAIQIEVNGTGVSVDTTRTTENAVETQCSGNTETGGLRSVSASDAPQNGTQTFSFSPASSAIEDGDTIFIDLSDADGVDYSSATGTVKSGKNKNKSHGTASFIDSNTIEFTATTKVNTGDTVTIEVDGYTIAGTSGETYSARFSRNSASDRDDFTIN